MALKQRGHEVHVILNEVYRSTATRLGLDFHAYSDERAFQAEMEDNRDPRSSRLGDRWERWLYPELRETYATIERLAADRQDAVILARSWTLAGRLASEKLGTPLATIYVHGVEAPGLMPTLPKGRLPMSGFARALQQPWLPPPLARLGYRRFLAPMTDGTWDAIFAKTLHRFQRELGLPPARGVLTRYLESPQLALGLWPEWFYERRRHWSTKMQTTGFVLHETRPDEKLSEDIERFLGGDSAVVFMAGTFRTAGAESFFTESVEVCRSLGMKGILLAESALQIPAGLPSFVLAKDYVPLHLVLPRARAVVHHGGIGTIARAFEAGVPQLVVPVFADQPLNGRRLEELGVGATVSPEDYRAPRVHDALSRLMQSSEVRDACTALRARMDRRAPIEAACRALEALIVGNRSRPEVAASGA